MVSAVQCLITQRRKLSRSMLTKNKLGTNWKEKRSLLRLRQNEGKWKEARQRQTKQWLIMLNPLPEDKE